MSKIKKLVSVIILLILSVFIFSACSNDIGSDNSGKTKVFSLPTPDKNLSMAPDLSQRPYAVYNMLVESDGFLKNIHLNIPVFSGITSIQRSDLIIDADQSGSEPQIFDEGQKYNL